MHSTDTQHQLGITVTVKDQTGCQVGQAQTKHTVPHPDRALPLVVEIEHAALYIRDLRRDASELEATIQRLEARVVALFNVLHVPTPDGGALVAASYADVQRHLSTLTPDQMWLLVEAATVAEHGPGALAPAMRAPTPATPLTLSYPGADTTLGR